MNQTIKKFTVKQDAQCAKQRGVLGHFLGPVRWFRRLVSGRNKKGDSWFRRFLSYLPFVLMAFVLAGAIGVLMIYAWIREDLPDPNKIADRTIAQTTRIYDRTGEIVLYEVHGNEKRTLVELDAVSPHVLNATIAAEDRDFYSHKGFKITGYIRAMVKNLSSGERRQGGSTITQQLVKKVLLTSVKTYERKVKELLLSIEIERSFSKDEILKMYLNEIPYGSVVYGIESAAETFFGKKAADLSLSESALLAALPQSPTKLWPYGPNRNLLVARQHWILDSMAELGYITPEEAEAAKADDVFSRLKENEENIIAPHFVFYVREQLAEELGEQMIERGGLKIITTLDVGKQSAAEEIIKEKYESLAQFNATNAALLAIDPKNGDILAMVGSADYFNDEISGKYNALLGMRQPGSSIKPIVYATAFERGYTPDTVLYDVTTEFGGGPNPYTPKNYDLKEHGPVTVREALAGSLNIPAVKMLYLAGLDNVITKAGEMGYTTLNDRNRFGLSLALGGAEVRGIEHIFAFTSFANDGMRVSPRSVLKVEDHNGNILIDNSGKIESKRVLTEQTARQINSILSDNSARAYIFGENSYLQLGERPVAAKSGTTNSYKDAWTIGYTPSLVAGVWVGNSDGKEMKTGADGSRIAAPIWNGFMRKTLSGTAIESFIPAEPVVTGKPILDGKKNSQLMIKIDSVSGLLATEYTPPELIIEKGFGVLHSILFFVDKDDPRGPMPENPEEDPMYSFWEKGVADWAAKQQISVENNPPPTLTDNVHLPENRPNIAVFRPQNGETVATRDMFADVAANSLRGVVRVEFSIGGDKFAVFEHQPFSGTVPIPNRFPKGFHTVTVTAFDDVGNRASADVTINLTAEAGPLGVQWVSPWNMETISRQSFPQNIKLNIEDVRSVQSLTLSVRSISNGTEEIIGTIERPPLPNISVQWDNPPAEGRYGLRLTATLNGGERTVEEIMVTVQ